MWRRHSAAPRFDERKKEEEEEEAKRNGSPHGFFQLTAFFPARATARTTWDQISLIAEFFPCVQTERNATEDL